MGSFFFHIQAGFFLASYEWWENANFSAKSQNHEFFFFSCRFSHFPPGSALFGVHVTFDRTERRHGNVDWRRSHIPHSEIFRRDEDWHGKLATPAGALISYLGFGRCGEFSMLVLISAENFDMRDMKSPPINATMSSFGSVECYVHAK